MSSYGVLSWTLYIPAIKIYLGVDGKYCCEHFICSITLEMPSLFYSLETMLYWPMDTVAPLKSQKCRPAVYSHLDTHACDLSRYTLTRPNMITPCNPPSSNHQVCTCCAVVRGNIHCFLLEQLTIKKHPPVFLPLMHMTPPAVLAAVSVPGL